MKKTAISTIWYTFIGLLLILLMFVNAQLVHGEEIGFNVQANLPENQLNKEISYYDLRMQPGQQQELTITISNTSGEPQTYEVNMNQAYTNKNGFIDYERNDVKPDESQQYDLSDIATYDSEITVAAQTSIDFPIQLRMPEAAFDGEILGGIQVLKKTEAVEGEIVNRYGYIIGLRLTETDTPVQRTLELKSIQAEQAFGSTGIVVKIQNPIMEGIGHLRYNVVIKDDQGKLVREKNYDNDMSIAPNSTYDFAIDWDDEPLEVGSYTLQLAISDAKDNQWDFTEDFEISAQEAKKVNQSLIPLEPPADGPSWLFILLGVLSGVVVSFLYLDLKRKKRLRQLVSHVADKSEPTEYPHE